MVRARPADDSASRPRRTATRDRRRRSTVVGRSRTVRVCEARSSTGGVDQNEASPRAVAAEQDVLDRGRDGVAILVVERRMVVRPQPTTRMLGVRSYLVRVLVRLASSPTIASTMSAAKACPSRDRRVTRDVGESPWPSSSCGSVPTSRSRTARRRARSAPPAPCRRACGCGVTGRGRRTRRTLSHAARRHDAARDPDRHLGAVGSGGERQTSAASVSRRHRP